MDAGGLVSFEGKPCDGGQLIAREKLHPELSGGGALLRVQINRDFPRGGGEPVTGGFLDRRHVKAKCADGAADLLALCVQLVLERVEVRHFQRRAAFGDGALVGLDHFDQAVLRLVHAATVKLLAQGLVLGIEPCQCGALGGGDDFDLALGDSLERRQAHREHAAVVKVFGEFLHKRIDRGGGGRGCGRRGASHFDQHRGFLGGRPWAAGVGNEGAFTWWRNRGGGGPAPASCIPTTRQNVHTQKAFPFCAILRERPGAGRVP